MAPGLHPVRRESPERTRHHCRRGVLPATGWQDAEPLVRSDEPEPAQLGLRGPADVAITRSTRQCRRCEADQSDPLAGGIHRDVAHRLADHPMTEPVVLVQFRAEATSVTRQHRGDPKARQPRISYPLHVASDDRCASISNQPRRSEARGVDYEKVGGSSPPDALTVRRNEALLSAGIGLGALYLMDISTNARSPTLPSRLAARSGGIRTPDLRWHAASSTS